VSNVTKASGAYQDPIPDLAERAGYLVELAARAPSVHNTQPWRFTVTGQAIDLYTDTSRQLLEDPAGREMIISCGAALFGLRLAIRSLGYQPEVDLFPEPSQRYLLARVRAGRPVPMTSDERAMLRAVPHRHTHRGAFEPGPLPGDLLARLQDDVTAEGATLAVIDGGPAYQRLTAILGAWSRRRDLYPASPAEIQSRAETQRWTRGAGSQSRDGVPAHAFPAAVGGETGHLPQRDFDLGRGWGFPLSGSPPAPVTAVMVTPGEDENSWLRAGQALQRLLLRATSQWVFASLQTQPLQSTSVRAQLRSSLALPGSPQLLLELGVVRTSRPTGRRPAGELTTDR
jgi:antitoxin (DNA-binding transcriptional repressor) of toxin-antitoxin stability system